MFRVIKCIYIFSFFIFEGPEGVKLGNWGFPLFTWKIRFESLGLGILNKEKEWNWDLGRKIGSPSPFQEHL